MPFEDLVFRPQSRWGPNPPPATATATATAPPPPLLAVAVAGRGFGPLRIEVEKQGFRTAWLIKGQNFHEKNSNRVLPY